MYVVSMCEAWKGNRGQRESLGCEGGAGNTLLLAAGKPQSTEQWRAVSTWGRSSPKWLGLRKASKAFARGFTIGVKGSEVRSEENEFAR